MTVNNHRSRFTGGDLDLLVGVIETNDSMLETAYAVKLIEAECRYPLNSVDDLRPVEKKHGSRIKLARCSVSLDHARRYLSAQHFPIRNRTELISRLLIAFETERWEQIQRASSEQVG